MPMSDSLDLAQHIAADLAADLATRLAANLAARSRFVLAHPVEANAVFVQMDEAALARLHAAGWFAYRFLDGSVRFMCSWATTAESVDELGEILTQIA